jgi:hypothetical protein
LNRATRRGKGIIAINPNVGVRHQGVERLVSELRGRPFDACSPPTIGTPLGYLTPHRTYREWVINAPDAVDAVVADLVDAIKRYGITFMEETVDLRTIVARMAEGKYGFRQDIEYRLPVALVLLGDIDAARAAVDAGLRSRELTHAEALREFRSFADNLDDYIRVLNLRDTDNVTGPSIGPVPRRTSRF